MSKIFATKIEATLPMFVKHFTQPKFRNYSVELWVFNDRETRKTAEAQLLDLGVNVRVYSAYKPLLHFFLEEISFDDNTIKDIDVYYPVNEHCNHKRFSLEAYPLGGLISEGRLQLIPCEDGTLNYNVCINKFPDKRERFEIFAPNKLNVSIIGDTYLSPTGWIRVCDPEGNLIQDERIYTDYEQTFDSVIKAVSRHQWEDKCPYFKTLRIQIETPLIDEPIAYAHEHISLTEALHEDLYFSIQEWFNVRVGKEKNDRTCQFGQVIPEIKQKRKGYSINVELNPYSIEHVDSAWQMLDNAKVPLSQKQIMEELDQIKGQRLTAMTISGREVQARYKKGRDKAVLISGGQHANETTGVVGALRAAKILAQRETSHFVISPLENPDGYAIHQQLMKENLTHMHHAARYTALGSDLAYHELEMPYEKAIRYSAQEYSRAKLHINLHGYPSHEWVRPFSGYIPQGFDMWTIPKGFFLILRYTSDPGYAIYAETFIHQLTAKLAEFPGLKEFNQRQLDVFQRHAGMSEIRLINGIPCLLSKVETNEMPLQIITEFPDEMIFGKYFMFGHELQKELVLVAYDIYQMLAGPFGEVMSDG